MKKIYIVAIVSALIIPLNSCLESLLPVRGNGVIVTESRRTGPFNQIENTTSIDVVYKQADSTSITIKADENLQEYIITETGDNKLEIKTRSGHSFLDFTGQALITISTPNLESIELSGSGIFIADKLSGDAVLLKLSGSGDISSDNIIFTDLTVLLSGSGNINIETCEGTTSDILLNGSGDINIKGVSLECRLKISGSGNVFGENHLTSSASVIITGSGNAFTYVEDDLNAIISGSGNIFLKGDPLINQTISGSGRIIKYK